MSSGSTLPVHRDFHSPGRERRKRARHRAQSPAFAGMNGNSTGIDLDLHQILDLSEEGLSFQSSTPMEVGEILNFSVDLADPKTYFHAVGRVVWSNASGRTGIRFQRTVAEDAHMLREWLVANIADIPDDPVADGVQSSLAEQSPQDLAAEDPKPVPRGNLSGLFAIEGLRLEIESLAFDLDSALQIVVQRALSLTRATGAAIALSDREEMVCRATAGPDAPPVGARLQVGSGFSGECVRTGQLLHCDDSEVDDRVDRESCRVLGIRSIMAAPLRIGEEIIGLIEIFSPHAAAFSQSDKTVLHGMAEIVQEAIHRATQVPTDPRPAPPVETPRYAGHAPFTEASQRDTESLVRSLAEAHTKLAMPDPEQGPPQHRGLRIRWIVIGVIAAVVLLAIWLIASRLQANSPRPQLLLPAAERSRELDRRASLEHNSVQDLMRLSSQGDTLAGFTLGLRYATGSDVPQDYSEAVRWFSFAAERGHVMAQSTLGAYYWAGRGVPQDFRKAYFWALLAQSAGDDASRARLPFLVSRLTREDVVDVQRQADGWMKEHQARSKSSPGQK